MGAGAGYDILTKDVSIVGDIQINSFDVREDKNWLITTVDCNVPIVGSVMGESYYYNSPWIEDVPMIVTNVVINFYKTEEFPNVTEDDIREVLTNDINYEGKGIVGGGWSHATFNGNWKITSWNDSAYTDDISSASITIDHPNIVNFIDLAVTGDNREYDVVFNGDALDAYEDQDEAIARLKELIREEIAESGIDSIDFSSCYVEELYWTEDVEGNIDIVDPWYDNIVYNAEVDFDEFEALGEVADELNEENDVGIDEGFDI
jgi:hypothetical protein